MSAQLKYVAGSVRATRAFGAALGELLRGGDCVALTGPLGAGKTHLVQGLARGVGVSADEPVVSPTFVLVREYAGRLTLFHMDSYRLEDSAELFELGLEEMLAGDGVVAVEWADRTPEAIPARACRLELAHAGEERRVIGVRWADAERLGRLRAWIAGPGAASEAS